MKNDTNEEAQRQKAIALLQQKSQIDRTKRIIAEQIEALESKGIRACIEFNWDRPDGLNFRVFDDGACHYSHETPTPPVMMKVRDPDSGTYFGKPLESPRFRVFGTNIKPPTPPENVNAEFNETTGALEVGQIHESVPVTRTAFNELQETVRVLGMRIRMISGTQDTQTKRIDQVLALNNEVAKLRSEVSELRREIAKSRWPA